MNGGVFIISSLRVLSLHKLIESSLTHQSTAFGEHSGLHLLTSLPPQIMDNWKHYKTKVASYWLIKLDSTKQRKVSGPQRSLRPSCVPEAKMLSHVHHNVIWEHVFACVFNNAVLDKDLDRGDKKQIEDNSLAVQKSVHQCANREGSRNKDHGVEISLMCIFSY